MGPVLMPLLGTTLSAPSESRASLLPVNPTVTLSFKRMVYLELRSRKPLIEPQNGSTPVWGYPLCVGKPLGQWSFVELQAIMECH